MKGHFVKAADVPREELDWGVLGWVTNPATTGAEQLTTLDVSIKPGNGHNFHKHPDQEEIITVVAGEIEQWLETERQTLRAGDTVFIPADVVHASFCTGDQPARLLVVLGPCRGESGYEVVEVGDQAPWSSLR